MGGVTFYWMRWLKSYFSWLWKIRDSVYIILNYFCLFQVYFESDTAYLILMALFSLSNGYLGSIVMTFGPKMMTNPHEQGQAASLLVRWMQPKVQYINGPNPSDSWMIHYSNEGLSTWRKILCSDHSKARLVLLCYSYDFINQRAGLYMLRILNPATVTIYFMLL